MLLLQQKFNYKQQQHDFGKVKYSFLSTLFLNPLFIMHCLINRTDNEAVTHIMSDPALSVRTWTVDSTIRLL